jgi:NodT family efflux transporter outer membrane factor (OMF) lipoprotein
MNVKNILLLGVGTLTLAACAAGPNYVRPVTPASGDKPFIAAVPSLVTADAPKDDWWRLYEDPVLDQLVADALAHNTDLRVAVANLEKARASLRESRSQRLPQSSVDASGNYMRTSAIQRAPSMAAEDWRIDGGLSLSYEVDLFGRVKHSIEAARGDADAAAAAADAVRVGIVAETARAYADASSSAERIGVAERTLALLDKTADLTTKRFDAGRTSRLDVARVLALRNQQRANIPPFRAQRDAALFRLALLTGRAPADLPPQVGLRAATLRLDRPVPVGDGRALLARRPDVREAERKLAAETARIGVATADLYPRISLGAGIGTTGNSVSDMFGAGPLRWLAGPLLSWAFPNIEGGRARIAQARATTRAALATFDGAVLTALQETETALSAYANTLQRRQDLRDAAEQARTAANISRAQLREGRVDFLTVLDAERTLAGAEADLAEADAQVAATQIDLFRALGGGWQSDPARLASTR